MPKSISRSLVAMLVMPLLGNPGIDAVAAERSLPFPAHQTFANDGFEVQAFQSVALWHKQLSCDFKTMQASRRVGKYFLDLSGLDRIQWGQVVPWRIVRIGYGDSDPGALVIVRMENASSKSSGKEADRRASALLAQHFQGSGISVNPDQARQLLRLPNCSESDLERILGKRINAKKAFAVLARFQKPAPKPAAPPSRGRVEVVPVNLSEQERMSSFTLPDMDQRWQAGVAADKELLIGLETDTFLPPEFDQRRLRDLVEDLSSRPPLEGLALPDLLHHASAQAPLETFFNRHVLGPWRQRRDGLIQLYGNGEVPDEGGAGERLIHVFASKAMQNRPHRPSLVLPEPDFETWRLRLVVQTYQRLSENAWADRDPESFREYGEKAILAQARYLRQRAERNYKAIASRSGPDTYGMFIQSDPLPHLLQTEGPRFDIAMPPVQAGRRLRFNEECVEALLRGESLRSADIADHLNRGVVYSALVTRLLKLYPRLEEEAVATMAMPIVDRWDSSEVDHFRGLPDDDLLPYAMNWIRQHGTPDEQARYRVGAGPSATEFTIPWPENTSPEKPFGDLETIRIVPGERDGEFHYFSPFAQILQQTNPRVLGRIEKILVTPFEQLVEGRDYDMHSGGRSVMVFVDWPVRINGRDVASFKVKAGVYDPSVFGKAYNMDERSDQMQPPRLGGFRSDGMAPRIAPDGRYSKIPRLKIPRGGTLLKLAKAEAYSDLRGLRRRIPFGFPLAYVGFPNHNDSEGQLTGAVVIGLPMADNTRGGDHIAVLQKRYGNDAWRLVQAVTGMMIQHGRSLRSMNDLGVAMRNFHLTNGTFLENEEFIHDTEDVVWKDHVTESEFFGRVLVGLRDVVVSFRQLEQFPFLASLAIEWIPGTLAGYFYDQVPGADIQAIEPLEVAGLLRDGEIPYRRNHPFIHRLLTATGLEHLIPATAAQKPQVATITAMPGGLMRDLKEPLTMRAARQLDEGIVIRWIRLAVDGQFADLEAAVSDFVGPFALQMFDSQGAIKHMVGIVRHAA